MPNPSTTNERGVLKLLGEHFSHIIPQSHPPHTTPPSLILGRKLAQQPADIFPIAADRNISRQHARLYWQPAPHGHAGGGWWCVECLGKNGMHVDDRFVDGNGVMRLEWGDGVFIKMQIGDVVFFVMQPVQAQQNGGHGQGRAVEDERTAR